MAFSQFSADGAMGDEPILLEVFTSKSVGLGRYQLWSEAKQIGVQNTEFSGEEILIPRKALLGPGELGFYTLAGWARTKEVSTLIELDNDFVVGMNLHHPHIKKLAVDVHFTDTEVCFITENVVSLTVLSDSDKISNEIEDCFDRPVGEAYMFFLTNVGRAAMAEIDGAAGEYILHQ